MAARAAAGGVVPAWRRGLGGRGDSQSGDTSDEEISVSRGVALDAGTPGPWQDPAPPLFYDAGLGEPVRGDAGTPQWPTVRDCALILIGDGRRCVDGDELDRLARLACPAGKGELVSLLLQGAECAGGASSAQATCCVASAATLY